MAVLGCGTGRDDQGCGMCFGGCFKAADLPPCPGGILWLGVPERVPGGAGSSVELIPGSICSVSLVMLLLHPLLGFLQNVLLARPSSHPIPSHGSRPDPLSRFSGTVSLEAAPCQRTARISGHREGWH